MAPTPGLPRTLKSVTVPSLALQPPRLGWTLSAESMSQYGCSPAVPHLTPTPFFCTVRSTRQLRALVSSRVLRLLQLTRLPGSAEVTVPPRLAYKC